MDILEEFSIYNSFSGITNNQFESLNATLKHLQSWHEVPVDVITPSTATLLNYNEVQRGLAGIWLQIS